MTFQPFEKDFRNVVNFNENISLKMSDLDADSRYLKKKKKNTPAESLIFCLPFLTKLILG